MNRYEEIETFVRTVEAGSFTAAAAQLGVAKSVVSRRIHELEQRLDTQLLVRSTRKLSLTDEGQSLYERVTRLLVEWEEAESSVGQQQAALKGSIRISVPLSFGRAHIGKTLLDFQLAHPDVSIDVDLTDRKVDLIAEGFDLAIRIGDLPDSTLIARKLTPITNVVAASPAYLKQHGIPLTPDELKTHRELRFGLRQRKSWQYTAPDGTQAAIANHGVVIVPRFIAYPALVSGELVEILSDYEWAGLNAYALYPSSKHLPRRVRELLDQLVASCGEGVPPWDQ